MRAIRCHRFAFVEEDEEKGQQRNKQKQNQQQQQRQRQRKSFKSRPKPLRLSDCLTLDIVPLPNEYFDDKESSKSTNKTKTMNTTKVLIRTEYAGVQYPDALQAQGLYQVKPTLPYIPGMDVVGVVVDVIHSSSLSPSSSSSSIQVKEAGTTSSRTANSRIQPGDKVLATMLENGGTGGLSEFVVAPLKYCHKLPNNIISSFPAAAAAFANVGRNYFAAYHSLVEVGNIRPLNNNNNNNNQEQQIPTPIILITGASGGVGSATIELAKAMGCIVIAGVGSTDKCIGPKALGADAVFCYGRTKNERISFRKQVLKFCQSIAENQQQQPANRSGFGVDLVVDVVMGDLFEEALIGCVKPLGTIALVGFTAGQRPIRPGLLLVKEIRVAGSIWGRIANDAVEEVTGDITMKKNKHRTMVDTILFYFANGKINPRIDRIIPLSKFIDAFEVFEVNKGRGNTVVSFNDDTEIHRRSTSRL